MSSPENPPAFPIAVPVEFQFANVGMTLRDWFAGQAAITDQMVAYAMGHDDGIDLTDDTARVTMCAVWASMRYEFADAMLAARAVVPKHISCPVCDGVLISGSLCPSCREAVA